jgi:dimeric dUTPase (all-alpha-NTP-PPase superfamily)
MDRFYKSGKEITREQILKDKIQALQSEVNEFSDELGLYKYWKQNHKVDGERILEEFADIFFFWLSIANELNYTDRDLHQAYMKKWQENIERQKNNY